MVFIRVMLNLGSEFKSSDMMSTSIFKSQHLTCMIIQSRLFLVCEDIVGFAQDYVLVFQRISCRWSCIKLQLVFGTKLCKNVWKSSIQCMRLGRRRYIRNEAAVEQSEIFYSQVCNNLKIRPHMWSWAFWSNYLRQVLTKERSPGLKTCQSQILDIEPQIFVDA